MNPAGDASQLAPCSDGTVCKSQLHTEDYQRRRQQEDLNDGGKTKKRKGMKSRWDRELQRRLGTPALWYMVCFTGKFDVTFLQKGGNPTQTVAGKQQPRQDLTRKAQQARDRVRWAESLHRQMMKGKRKFTHEEQALLEDLVLGKLQEAANVATRKSGYGRIKHPDGRIEDIPSDRGGIVRTVLDNVVLSTGDENLDEDDENLDEDVPCW